MNKIKARNMYQGVIHHWNEIIENCHEGAAKKIGLDISVGIDGCLYCKEYNIERDYGRKRCEDCPIYEYANHYDDYRKYQFCGRTPYIQFIRALNCLEPLSEIRRHAIRMRDFIIRAREYELCGR